MARAARGQQQNNDPEPDDDQEPDEDDQDEDDQEEEDDSDYKPPSKQEWEDTQAALKKANSEAKRFRTQLRNAKKATSGDTDEEQERAAERVAAQWKPRLVKSAARAALAEAGAKKTAIARLARAIDLDSVEVDDDGEIDGLEDQIEELKDDLPELFKDEDDDDTPPRRKRKLGKTDAGARSANGSKTTQKDASTRQAEALLGRR
jgi:hypothetical protein